MNRARRLPWPALLAAACAGPQQVVHWRRDVPAALAAARADGREVVAFVALPGRAASDRMQAGLGDPVVLGALAAHDFAAILVDGAALPRVGAEWIGGGDGFGVAVLDAAGQVYAARPGPQDPGELAAFLRRCAAARGELARLRAAAAAPAAGPAEQHQLGCLYLELGCRVHSEPLLLDAALAGVADARHRLARLYALDGNVVAARRWLAAAPRTAPAQFTEGYVLFKERRFRDAVAALEQALAAPGLGDDRQRALLFLGKALHEDRRDDRAVAVLEALVAEGTGSTFEAAARHALGHIRAPGDHPHD